ncbi:MAG: hypothetical protein ACOC31_03790 [Bacteroidota bacterium]
MKSIILFRYHNSPEFCKDRLEFIRKLNPEVPIYGLFGGEEDEFEFYHEELQQFFNQNYCIKNKSAQWKWQHSDLAYRMWFKDLGCNIEFDSVIVLEWDLVFFEPIGKIYEFVQQDQVGLAGLVPLKEIEKKWFWTRNPEQRKNWLKLLDYVETQLDYSESPFASLCPGVMLPKRFLEKYSQIEVPELCHDELRIPLFAQALGFELTDLGFFKKWFSKNEWKYFNCNNHNIDQEIIQKELAKTKGRKVFHPFREEIKTSFPALFYGEKMVE